MIKRAFSLLSFLVYLIIMSMTISLSIHWYISYIYEYRTTINHQKKFIEGHFAHDILLHDLRKIPHINALRVIEKERIIWLQETNLHIGFVLKNGSLLRMQGTYQKNKDSWKTVKMSHLASYLSNFLFSVQEREDHSFVIGYSYTILDDTKDSIQIKNNVIIKNDIYYAN